MPMPTPQMRPGLNDTQSLPTQSLMGPGPISTDSAMEELAKKSQLQNDIIDFCRLQLADGMVDVELDKEHYELAVKQALIKYRQRAPNSVEESYAFLDLLPETQEYILPDYIMEVRAAYRRGIGSVSGTTASQFEPFASGYLNTYMLVAGRVGGLTNYELFVDYQKLAMRMFGGFLNFTWNRVTKKLTLVRKIPNYGHSYFVKGTLTANGTAVGSTITVTFKNAVNLSPGDLFKIDNCPIQGYSGSYHVETISQDKQTLTVTAYQTLGATSVTGWDLSCTQFWSPVTDYTQGTESVLLQIYNYKPDIMLLSDPYVYPWLQEYALAQCKMMLGQGRGKYTNIAGPQGGTQLNGQQLLAEAKEEMAKLEEDLKHYVDGSTPLTMVIG